MLLNSETRQNLAFLFLLCLVFTVKTSAQSPGITRRLNQARLDFDNGNFSRSIEAAETAIEAAEKTNNRQSITDGLEILANAQMALQRYEEAEKNLSAALQNVSDDKLDTIRKAHLYLKFGSLRRSQRRFVEAFDYSKQAVALLPDDKHILAEHYLNFGRILYASGFDLSALIWLEKGEKLLESEKTTSAKLDTYRFLALAWWAKLNYQKAVLYFQKWRTAAESTRFKQKHRQALFDLSTVLSESGQQKAAMQSLQNGLRLASANEDLYQAGKFLTSLLLNALDNGDLEKAPAYLEQLEKVNQNGSYSFEITLGRAIIAAYKNENENSLRLFSRLEKMENSSEFILPGWKLKIAKRNEDWKKVIESNQKLFDLTVENNFRDELPAIHLDFARAYFNLNQIQSSKEHLEKSLAYVEEIRRSENTNLSLGLLETYHNAYRLLVQIKAEQPEKAFELADFLKARLLKDKINDSPSHQFPLLTDDLRRTLEELSLRYERGQTVTDQIEKIEKSATAKIPQLNLTEPDLSELEKISDLEETAIISYFYTLDKKLLAFVWEKDKSLQSIYLPISEDETNALAKATEQKIKSFIFFKREGKEIYDKLLKPLNLTAKHLIIVPDKSLWKIPFQALSADGERYLIEEKLITYAPSISILIEQLKKPKPNRQTLQAYANSSYENRILQFVNAEALSVAGIYGSKPILNATVSDFALSSDKTDILHFSMHAQVDKEQPLDSFLGFRKVGTDDGRLMTEELLKIKLKKGSLAFLASCDTNNVLSGEGLVSLAWAMMGSGATTVVSAQWEANDRSTEIFTKTFYIQYKQGNSSAGAMQKAALELIKNKSQNMHEPYYWADFTLNGDFR